MTNKLADKKLYFFHPMRGKSYEGVLCYLDDPIDEYLDVAEKHYPGAIDYGDHIDYYMIMEGGDLLQIYEWRASTFDISIFYQNSGGKEALIQKLEKLREKAIEETEKY